MIIHGGMIEHTPAMRLSLRHLWQLTVNVATTDQLLVGLPIGFAHWQAIYEKKTVVQISHTGHTSTPL